MIKQQKYVTFDSLKKMISSHSLKKKPAVPYKTSSVPLGPYSHSTWLHTHSPIKSTYTCHSARLHTRSSAMEKRITTAQWSQTSKHNTIGCWNVELAYTTCWWHMQNVRSMKEKGDRHKIQHTHTPNKSHCDLYEVLYKSWQMWSLTHCLSIPFGASWG